MANIQGVYDKKKSEDDGSDDEDKNEVYVGGAVGIPDMDSGFLFCDSGSCDTITPYSGWPRWWLRA